MAYQGSDAIMRKASAAKSAAANSLSPFGGPGDAVAGGGGGLAKRVGTATKKFGNPVSAETGNYSQGELLRYPLSTNYLASMTYRLKSVNPWDVDNNVAKNIFDMPLLFDAIGQFKGEESEPRHSSGQEGLNEGQEASRQSVRPEDSYGVGQDGEFSANAAAGSAAASASFKARNNLRQQQENQATKGLLGVTTSYVKNASSVTLYMPQAINMNDTVNYNISAELGVRGAAFLSAMNNAGGLAAAAKTALKETFSGLSDLFDARLVGEAARLAAARGANLLPQDLQNAASIGLQVKVNPNTRALFEGVNIRQFTFAYEFVARSPQEADQVQKIIKFFRTELYPSTFGRREAGIPIGYKFPHLFEIKFRWADAEMQIPQPMLCYLRDVQTTFNPQSMSFHADGKPTVIQMTLMFNEWRAMTREDVEEGY